MNPSGYEVCIKICGLGAIQLLRHIRTQPGPGVQVAISAGTVDHVVAKRSDSVGDSCCWEETFYLRVWSPVQWGRGLYIRIAASGVRHTARSGWDWVFIPGGSNPITLFGKISLTISFPPAQSEEDEENNPYYNLLDMNAVLSVSPTVFLTYDDGPISLGIVAEYFMYHRGPESQRLQVRSSQIPEQATL